MFDTIYAMSDKKDDIKIGVNSTAILFGAPKSIAVEFTPILISSFLSDIAYIVSNIVTQITVEKKNIQEIRLGI